MLLRLIGCHILSHIAWFTSIFPQSCHIFKKRCCLRRLSALSYPTDRSKQTKFVLVYAFSSRHTTSTELVRLISSCRLSAILLYWLSSWRLCACACAVRCFRSVDPAYFCRVVLGFFPCLIFVGGQVYVGVGERARVCVEYIA